jgi:hypothetical protein
MTSIAKRKPRGNPTNDAETPREPKYIIGIKSPNGGVKFQFHADGGLTITRRRDEAFVVLDRDATIEFDADLEARQIVNPELSIGEAIDESTGNLNFKRQEHKTQ